MGFDIFVTKFQIYFSYSPVSAERSPAFKKAVEVMAPLIYSLPKFRRLIKIQSG